MVREARYIDNNGGSAGGIAQRQIHALDEPCRRAFREDEDDNYRTSTPALTISNGGWRRMQSFSGTRHEKGHTQVSEFAPSAR